ncbi:MAG: hypothetical protein PHY34_03690 [Patescibacteria group bacterium]|nr:hypothetical protein [Patescibacteria group bacterium]MDD5716006.1 hypothetical protein [Patescibacteria group bacterium]
MQKKALLIIPVLIAVALIVSGCGEKAAEKAIEKATNSQVDIDADNDRVTINTNGGSYQAGEGVSVPDGFPEDVYVVDGNVTAAFTYEVDKNYSISIESTKSVNELKTLYEQKLADDGWTITMSYAAEGSVTLAATKGENRSVSVGLNNNEDANGAIVVITTMTEDATNEE